MRSAGCENNHPTLPTLLQIYHLLQVSKILRPPKFGNCESSDLLMEQRPKITFEDFKEAFNKKKSVSYRQDQLRMLEEKLENYVDDGSWDFNGDELLEIDLDIMDLELVNCVIYYLVGFICRQMQKKSKGCAECIKAFESQEELSVFPVSEFTSIKNRGKLIYPKQYIFNTLLKIEKIFLNKFDSDNVLESVLSEMFEQKMYLKFPCKKHKASRLSECIHYYISVRIKQMARLINKNDINTLSNIKKKESKVIS